MKNVLMVLILSLMLVMQARGEEVTITVNGCKIKGTLEIPKSDKPLDVVLIIAGSGPTDRDGNNKLIPGKNNSYKMLADLFYKNGIASLRYDKRTVGESDKVNQADLTFEMYVNDAVEWVKMLKNDKRFGKIIILGHSEGSLLGMIAATQINADKYISLCGAGKPAYKIISEQFKNGGVPPAELELYDKLLDSLKNGNKIKTVPSIKSIKDIFRPNIQKYLISWFKYDPADIASKLTAPSLFIGGTTDIQVDSKDAELLSKVCKNSTLAIIENMNHVLKEVKTKSRGENFKSYSDPELQLSSQLCTSIIEFVKK